MSHISRHCGGFYQRHYSPYIYIYKFFFLKLCVPLLLIEGIDVMLVAESAKAPSGDQSPGAHHKAVFCYLYYGATKTKMPIIDNRHGCRSLREIRIMLFISRNISPKKNYNKTGKMSLRQFGQHFPEKNNKIDYL